MKSSSSTQLQLDFVDDILSSENQSEGRNKDSSARKFSFSNFDTQPRRAFDPEVIKRAGRINAASISDVEYNQLLMERKQLLTKKYTGDFTKREENRLTYVRWSLDRVEDARHGHGLELLEGAVSQYESFLSEIRSLQATLEKITQGKRA